MQYHIEFLVDIHILTKNINVFGLTFILFKVRKLFYFLILIYNNDTCTLLQPFWPTGSGCARGFLGCFDAAWAMRSFGLGKRPLEIIAERENAYRILAQTTPENLNKNFANYGICPDSRYTNLSKTAVKVATVRHLFDCHDGPIDSVDGVEPMDTSTVNEPQQPQGKTWAYAFRLVSINP